MKYLALILLALSASAQAATFAESTTMDGSKIILTLLPCEAHKDTYQAFITKEGEVLSQGCWKATRSEFLILWNEKTLSHYAIRGWILK